MKKLILFFSLAIFSFAVTPVAAQHGAEVRNTDFAFTVDDGCGFYAVSGTLKRISSENGVVYIYKGIATEIATGESVPLNVRVVEHGNQNGFTLPFTLVFPSKAVIHSVFHINETEDGIHVVEESWVKCK
ncbi:hypothetical protein [Flavilitoribacter nigricans]|uniref:Uncharacterized protein n=1 Tax=Flavilitoribacter nigricans (strain ATCC 23147 / DSM 23189 / NBRC 102662 / NCIMB 1420 / SS-2) TaxID=1122177 RepID=A0A2D0N1Z2_FLAN2|nr:hypothetical protein [Flavilitoribacter nigricans]PHN02396.1 hypothetical protein CRP01_31945 [Flavilitoribacter nigricans DSM 23189 = NBRC 102662]